MEKLLPSSGEFEKEWQLEFHGVKYEINLGTSSAVLTLDVEQVDTEDKWSAEFTSQYIEEITHKAGNFKKFETFVMMLTSAFARESDTVYVDLLTYNDLELMKARKLGNGNPNSSLQSQSSSSSALSRSHMKRYVILTYNSEYDRVHFPLPLSYEENPSVESLKRTIFRLKRRLKEGQERDQMVSIKESRDLKMIDAQLRQENTELRHRLRLQEKRTGDEAVGNSEVLKMRRQIEQLKNVLGEKSSACERLKAENIRLQSATNSFDSGRSRADKELQSKVRQLQSMLEMERLDHRKEITRLKKELSDARRSSTYGTRTRRAPGSGGGSSSYRSSSSQRSHGSLERSSHSPVPRSRSPLTNPSRPSAVRGSTMTKKSHYNVSSSGYGQSRQPRSSQTTTRSTASRRGPVGSSRASNSRSPNSNGRASRSRSPSSSLGGVFDPTAYAREKAEKRERAKASRSRAWGAGGAGDRYSRDSGYISASSGYSSATSQSSAGSRRSNKSAGSTRSMGSRDPQSRKSKQQTETTRKASKAKTKAKSSKSKSPSRKRKNKRDHFHSSVLDMAQKDPAIMQMHSEQYYFERSAARSREDVKDVLSQYLHEVTFDEPQHDANHVSQEAGTDSLSLHREKPPLPLSGGDSGNTSKGVDDHTSRTHFPIDDIEDDSDTDSNLDSSSEEVDFQSTHRGGGASQSQADPRASSSKKEEEDIATFRSSLVQPQPSVTSEKSVRMEADASQVSVSSLKLHTASKAQLSVESFQDSLEKENLPNAMIAASVRPKPSDVPDDDDDVSDIDRRLSDLQKFLDKARTGIMAVVESSNDES